MGSNFIDESVPNDVGKLVLHVPRVVDSPQKAVRIALVAKSKRDQRGDT